MLLTDWDWDVAKKVWQEEAKEEGRQLGLSEGELIGRKATAFVLLQDGTFSKEKIAEMTNLELAEVEVLALQLGNN